MKQQAAKTGQITALTAHAQYAFSRILDWPNLGPRHRYRRKQGLQFTFLIMYSDNVFLQEWV